MKKRLIAVLLTLTAIAGLTTGCGSNSTSASNDGVRTIIVAYAPNYKPITYQDENGNEAGYDIEVFKKIDEMLPEYEFKYEGVEKDTMNMGVEAGTYQVGINGLFKNATRLETYLMTDQQMGGTPVGVVTATDRNDLTNLDDAVALGAKSTPVGTAGGIMGIIDSYNAEHPGAEFSYETSAESDRASNYAAIAAGQYDFCLELVTVFNSLDASVTNGVKINPTFMVVGTYPIINKEETELAEKINDSLVTLYENGTLKELALEYYGEDITAFFEQ
jgi:ABC-type amino acid transport substrate-binding protein